MDHLLRENFDKGNLRLGKPWQTQNGTRLVEKPLFEIMPLKLRKKSGVSEETALTLVHSFASANLSLMNRLIIITSKRM